VDIPAYAIEEGITRNLVIPAVFEVHVAVLSMQATKFEVCSIVWPLS
jgi:hypothetical protein